MAIAIAMATAMAIATATAMATAICSATCIMQLAPLHLVGGKHYGASCGALWLKFEKAVHLVKMAVHLVELKKKGLRKLYDQTEGQAND